MKIKTSRFGTIDVDETRIISFPRSIPGFPDEKQYILVPHDSDSPFYWLQSVDNPDLAFIVINPFVIAADYSFEIPDPVLDDLGITHASRVQTLVLITIRQDGNHGDGRTSITANLLGPLVINTENMSAAQIVLDPAVYDVRFRLPLKVKTG